jgi:DNA-binding GntR family transcriptional regulator
MEGAAAETLPIAPLEERESIEHRVAQALRGLIVSGQLPEATQLVQRDLAARLGVSQTPVRASLGRLAREGFVTFSPTGRAFVSRLTREDFEEIYATRLGLEGLAARLGAAAVGPKEIAQMRKLLERLRAAAAREDVDEYIALREDFYGTAYRASGRRRLVEEVERLYWRSERYNRLVLSTPGRLQESLGRYAAFHAACEANDSDRAEQIVQETMRWGLDSVSPELPSERDA